MDKNYAKAEIKFIEEKMNRVLDICLIYQIMLVPIVISRIIELISIYNIHRLHLKIFISLDEIREIHKTELCWQALF